MNGTVWLAWIAANAIGGAIGGAAVNAYGLVGLVFFGVPIGVAQYLVLRLFWQVRWTWILAAAVGLLVGWILFFPAYVFVLVLYSFTNALLPLRVSAEWQSAGSGVGAIAGLIVGTTQKVVTGFPSSPASPGKLWEGLSAVAGLLAFGMAGGDLAWRVFAMSGMPVRMTPAEAYLLSSSTINPFEDVFSPVLVVIAGAAFGAIYGAITGIALARLPRSAVVGAR